MKLKLQLNFFQNAIVALRKLLRDTLDLETLSHAHVQNKDKQIKTMHLRVHMKT